MTKMLRVSIGQHSDKGCKPVNQDFYGAIAPRQSILESKGVAAVVADGISSSPVSQIASQTAVRGFLDDYFATPECWSVKTSAQRVTQALNSWLYAQTYNGHGRYNLDLGYVCTFSALVLKSNTAYLFHVGDSRICLLRDSSIEQLTEDHRSWISQGKSYLNRALGMRDRLDIDYRSVALQVGDIFILTTDGVHEFAESASIVQLIQHNMDNLDVAATEIIAHARSQGSDDNLTAQILRVDELPQCNIKELQHQATTLPFPPELHPRMDFDGFHILRELHVGSRSHVFLAQDIKTRQPLVLKAPSVDKRDDAAYLERFLMEDWIARRVNHAYIVKSFALERPRNFLYTTTEYIEGQTLAQWIIDHPSPDLESVRRIVEQVAGAVQALHRQEILHQDLRPENIMVGSNDTIKLIDFGSARVAGVVEMGELTEYPHLLGSIQYTAPEYFLGQQGSHRSDLFSLGVLTYQMLSGQLPYGTQVARSSNRTAQNRLVYRRISDNDRTTPTWIDDAIRKAVHINPNKRYAEISEFLQDMRRPNPGYWHRKQQLPLMERNPLMFWKGVSLILLIITLLLLGAHPLLNQYT